MNAITERAPRLGIILGSGLGAVAEALEDAVTIPYTELPDFPAPSVHGHAGTLGLGTLSGLPVAVLQGRRHVYEGGDAGAMRGPVRALKAAGAEALFVTNAAGSLNAEVGPGSLMAISDHINMLGVNPLTGPNDEAIGPRLPSRRGAAFRPHRRRLADRGGRAGLADGDPRPHQHPRRHPPPRAQRRGHRPALPEPARRLRPRAGGPAAHRRSGS